MTKEEKKIMTDSYNFVIAILQKRGINTEKLTESYKKKMAE